MKTPWYKITFTPQQIAEHRALGLLEDLRFILSSRDAAVLGDGGIYDYYFTPAAVALARDLLIKYGGSECPAPKKSIVSELQLGDTLANIPFAPE